MGSRIRLVCALAFLLSLFLLASAGLRSAERGRRAREEARAWVARALALRGQPGGEEAYFRRAHRADPSSGADLCEEGMRLERQGDLIEAAESYHACIQADPRQAYAYLAYGDALLRARGSDAKDEVRSAVEEFRKLAGSDPVASRDEAAHRQAADLMSDLESLTGGRTRGGGSTVDSSYSAEEIEEILLRDPRGVSRYEGPRVPLRLGFLADDAILGAMAGEQLRSVVRALRDGRLAEAEIQIEGYTDDVEGNSEHGRLQLSLRRAEAVRSFLVASGIPVSRLKVQGYGDRYPLATNDTEAGRKANRRVELVNLQTREKVRRDARGEP